MGERLFALNGAQCVSREVLPFPVRPAQVESSDFACFDTRCALLSTNGRGGVNMGGQLFALNGAQCVSREVLPFPVRPEQAEGRIEGHSPTTHRNRYSPSPVRPE